MAPAFCLLNAVCLCRRYPWLEPHAALELSQVILGAANKCTSFQVVRFLASPSTRAIAPLDEMLALARCLRLELDKSAGMVSTLADDAPG